MALLVRGGDVYTPGRLILDGAVLIQESRIASVGPWEEVRRQASEPEVEEVDARGHIVAPGLIDLQVNGAGGRLLTDEPTVDALKAMSAALAPFGCTAFLPTIISTTAGRTLEALRAVKRAMAERLPGAVVLGCHVEGPFINPTQAGVHDQRFIRPPSRKELSHWLEVVGSSLRLLTLAPELPGAREVVEEAHAHGVAVAVGHSAAGYTELVAAQEWGVGLATHLFNAMVEMTGREPGTAGAALALENFSVSLIADGLHVHPAMLKLAVRTKGAERVVLVSDAMPPVGTEMADFPLYDMRISVQDGRCLTPEGRLAGSVLTMNRAVENMRRLAEVSLVNAFAMATINPARAIAVEGSKGTLEEGKDADLLVCDQDLNVLLTVIEGRIVHRSPEL